ncbi:AidA/PixA family protein [Melittangium boletus]|uniref:Inclusion body protein n=1 Tax=Melittangium boletus DSM 14713 TaxID=1294270 RepID=A0A250IFY1_9BACT|nr:AidA/PixA family protein [Melittangium boletus]ATB30734.1 hypothetical protein MEBOL_004195 [Melittangium boletus DSM 14713]
MASDGSSFVDILTVIDAKGIINDMNSPGTQLGRGTRDYPSPLYGAEKYAFMLVKRSESKPDTEATDELRVSVSTNDILRWRTTSMTMNTGYGVLLYDVHISQGDDLVRTPTRYVIEGIVPKPKSDKDGNGLLDGSEPYQDAILQSTARSPGEVTYQLRFMIVDRTNNPIAYFSWDPFITIS